MTLTAKPLPITAIVLTANEEKNLDRCLQSLAFCDELLVVDSGSTDRTPIIAQRYTNKVISLPWKGFTDTRNEALGHATHEWILSIDADEVVTPELAGELRQLFAAPRTHFAYSVPRKTIHFGRWIRHGGWYPNRLVRLFHQHHGTWKGGELHEFWACNDPVGELRSDLEHYSFSDLSDQVGRNNLYSSLGASKLKREGTRFSVVRLFTKPLSKFLETYVVKRGFLDGYPGFIISVSAAYSVFLKWAKLWEINHAKSEG